MLSLRRPQQVNWVKVDDDVPSHAVITGSDLYIENLNKSYNGTYRCVASNSVGESYDDYILYVYGKFTKLKQPSTFLSHTLTRAEYEINKFDRNNISFSLGYHTLLWTLSYLETLLISFTALSLWRNDSRLVLDCNNRPLFKRICVVQGVFMWWAIVVFTMHSCACKKGKKPSLETICTTSLLTVFIHVCCILLIIISWRIIKERDVIDKQIRQLWGFFFFLAQLETNNRN